MIVVVQMFIIKDLFSIFAKIYNKLYNILNQCRANHGMAM